MKKLVCTLLAALMLLSAAVAEQVFNSVDVNVLFNGDSNVRFGPSLNDRGFDVAMKGSVRTFLFDISVDDRGVAWYFVGDGDETGWVSSRYSTLETAEGYALDAVAEDVLPVLFADADLYSVPVEDADFLLTRLNAADAEVEFLGLIHVDENESCWYCVRVGECEGWVSDASMELQYS